MNINKNECSLQVFVSKWTLIASSSQVIIPVSNEVIKHCLAELHLVCISNYLLKSFESSYEVTCRQDTYCCLSQMHLGGQLKIQSGLKYYYLFFILALTWYQITIVFDVSSRVSYWILPHKKISFCYRFVQFFSTLKN